MTSDPYVILPITVDTIDLSKKWNNADFKIWKHITKDASTSQTVPPSLNDGAIFANDSSLWLYGGAVSYFAFKNITAIPPNGIWRYDFATSLWSKPSAGGDPTQRLFLGMSIQAGNSNGYHLSGVKSSRSDAVYYAEVETTLKDYMVQGLLSFHEYEQSFSNLSTTGLNQHGTVTDGFLSYIQTFGGKGILVAFGGFTEIPGEPLKYPVRADVDHARSDLDDARIQVSMQNITVYDIASQTWYPQQTTGDIPSWRFDGCSIVVSAADQSSHSIYVFGGWGQRDVIKNDNFIYVLSIPSFTWIRVTLDADQRFRHKCHLMGNNHMLVVGGIRPGARGDDAVSFDITGCDNNPKFSQGLGIFSLNNHTWTTDYDPVVGSTPYQVHPSISKVIGGNTIGGATKRTPEKGFSSDALRELLGVERQSSARTTPPAPTSSTPSSEPTFSPNTSGTLSTGDIAGIVIGAVSFTILSLGLIWLLRYRRRWFRQQPAREIISNSQRTPVTSEPRVPIEVDAGLVVPEMRSGGTEESLARMYGSYEVSNATERYEMPFAPQERAMPSLIELHELSGS
ncbi:MAG: hypothetical protein Q9225_007527 [Loekoesia sp. 1 TL-2023]